MLLVWLWIDFKLNLLFFYSQVDLQALEQQVGERKWMNTQESRRNEAFGRLFLLMSQRS